jgi:predicted O-methyltransferase YrrM
MVVAAFWMGRRSSPVAETRTTTADLLPHLPTCDKPQSPLSLPQLARLYQPSKFWGYAHTNYDRVYPHYLEAYRGKHFRMLEIGLSTGQGSLLWQAYFPCATLYGLEVVTSNTNTTGAAAISTIQGDQGDRAFLEGDFLQRAHGGHFDVIIDDGGHHYEQQVTSYQVLFDQALSPGGIYVIEDIETSYWKTGQDLYGQPVTRGGQSEAETVVNKFKQLVDVGTSASSRGHVDDFHRVLLLLSRSNTNLTCTQSTKSSLTTPTRCLVRWITGSRLSHL